MPVGWHSSVGGQLKLLKSLAKKKPKISLYLWYLQWKWNYHCTPPALEQLLCCMHWHPCSGDCEESWHDTCWHHHSPKKLKWQSALPLLSSPKPCTRAQQCTLTPQCHKCGVPHRSIPERARWCQQFLWWWVANGCTWSKIWKMCCVGKHLTMCVSIFCIFA